MFELNLISSVCFMVVMFELVVVGIIAVLYTGKRERIARDNFYLMMRMAEIKLLLLDSDSDSVFYSIFDSIYIKDLYHVCNVCYIE